MKLTDNKMMYSGRNAEWKFGMGYLGYFVAMVIHNMRRVSSIKTPLPPTNKSVKSGGGTNSQIL